MAARNANLQAAWDEDLRKQAASTGITITTEYFDGRTREYESWAVNMDRCHLDWNKMKLSSTAPRFHLLWENGMQRWTCIRVSYPQEEKVKDS